MNPDEKQPHSVAFLTTVILAILIAYPLSVGPVGFVLVHNGYSFAPKALQIFYAPLVWLVDHTPQEVENTFKAYTQLWGVP
jgi:hypothetical protein